MLHKLHTLQMLHMQAPSAQVFLTPTHLAIAMEYAPGGDLYQYLLAQQPNHGLPEDQARWFFQQLLVGLDYCHRKVLHHCLNSIPTVASFLFFRNTIAGKQILVWAKRVRFRNQSMSLAHTHCHFLTFIPSFVGVKRSGHQDQVPPLVTSHSALH